MTAPEAVHIGRDDLPYIDIGDGSKLRVVQVKPKEGLWIVENINRHGSGRKGELSHGKVNCFYGAVIGNQNVVINIVVERVWHVNISCVTPRRILNFRCGHMCL